MAFHVLDSIKQKGLIYFSISMIISTVIIMHCYQSSPVIDRHDSGNVIEKRQTESVDEIFTNPVKLRSLAINKTKFLHYLSRVSNSTLNKACEVFGVSSLTSALLQRQFLRCAGLKIYSHFSDSEGNIQLPKQFHKCKKMSFQNSGLRIALVSWPGSGNSWVRQLIESTTGIYTGSVHCDVNYIKMGMLGEGITTGNVMAIKYHFNYKPTAKVIYIIRNPYDAIVAEWNRRLSTRLQNKGSSTTQNPHLTILSKERFGERKDWNFIVKRFVMSWRKHVEKWLNPDHYNNSFLLVVKFEDLSVNLRKELIRIMKHLEYPYTENDLDCTINSNTQSFHRSYSKSFEHYTVNQTDIIYEQIRLVKDYLRKFNISYVKHVVNNGD